MSKTILMPELSPTMSTGMLSRWLVNIGDKVEIGDIIAEIETEKVTVEYEAVESGYLETILIDAGADEINVGEIIATLSDAPIDTENQNSLVSGPKEPKEATTETVAEQEPVEERPEVITSDESVIASRQSPAEILMRNIQSDIKISPLARRMAFQAGIEVTGIKGSGAGGRITKDDIQKAVGIAPSPTSEAVVSIAQNSIEIPYEYLPLHQEQPLNNMRKTVAERLTQSSQQIPHFYMSVDCQMDELLSLRQSINEKRSSDKQEQSKISVNDFVIKAVAKALHSVPEANVMWADNKLLAFNEADIAVAVSIEGGLITPVIKGCINKSLGQISTMASQLIEKAKTGKLTPADYQGGTFTISNLGMFGISQFNSIINPPQSGILSVGSTESKPMVEGESIVIKKMMTLTLAMDHRCIDGVTGALLLKQIQAYLESPLEILL